MSHRENRGSSRLVTLLTVLLILVFSGVASEAAQKSKPQRKPCAADLDSCPSRGCAKDGTPDALANRLKRTQPPSDNARLLTLDDFEQLQDQATHRVGQKVNLTKTQRNTLRVLSTAAGQVSEGDVVAVSGYIVGGPRPNKSGESVNCRLKGSGNNDFHIPIARDPTDSEFDAIVVEMIPQRRPKEWSVRVLKRVANEKRPVLLRGQLFYDNKHVVNDDQDSPRGGQPKRFSLWEIHPVTEFYVCMAAHQKCDPNNVGDGWKSLKEVEP